MFRGYRLLALIPARGGSKRLHDKNNLNCAGKTLIGWAIKAAKDTGYFDEISVSTDKYFHQEGVGVIVRPPELATDTASMQDVIDHAATISEYDFVVVLQPTSPLRTGKDIQHAIHYYFQTHETGDTLVSVYLPRKQDWFMGASRHLYHLKTSVYCPNGAIYLLPKGGKLFERALPFVMPEIDSVDVDTKEDFDLAERLLKERNGRAN